jgi:hypothetical protein
LMLLAMTNSSESDNPCCNNGNKMGEHCWPTKAATPIMLS